MGEVFGTPSPVVACPGMRCGPDREGGVQTAPMVYAG